jgi:hypothetical protein
METKQCKQCGEVKPLTQFRQYYGGRKGYYTVCKSCEKINSRAKYLERKMDSRTQLEEVELNKIHRLYDAQRACGLQPPRRDSGRHTKLSDSLDDMINAYESKANIVPELSEFLDTEAIPAELQQWLSCELTEEPDYYLDKVYEDLKSKYRPVLKIDQETMLPSYDDTYKQVLEVILGRFNDYEDAYYEGD